MMAGAYQGDLDPNATCPKGLDKTFCNTPGLLAPGYITNVLDDSFTKHYNTDTRLYNWIAKFNFQLNPNNSLVLQYIGSPVDGVDGPVFGGFERPPTAIASARSSRTRTTPRCTSSRSWPIAACSSTSSSATTTTT